VAKEIIIEEEEEDPIDKLIEMDRVKKKRKNFSPFGKELFNGKWSEEIQKHINDQEAYMAPLEMRTKIIGSLVSKTPEPKHRPIYENKATFLTINKDAASIKWSEYISEKDSEDSKSVAPTMIKTPMMRVWKSVIKK